MPKQVTCPYCNSVAEAENYNTLCCPYCNKEFRVMKLGEITKEALTNIIEEDIQEM